MRPATTLVRTLCAGVLVADALGCGEGTPSSPATGTISGTVTFAKLFAAPPPPVQHAAASSVTRVVPPLAPKTRRAQGALPALVRPFGRASGPHGHRLGRRPFAGARPGGDHLCDGSLLAHPGLALRDDRRAAGLGSDHGQRERARRRGG